MSVIVDNITYNIEDENLMDIEYYEILTMDEIIKDNPTFIAFSREEIFNELYDFLQNSNKADSIADLFFKVNVANLINYVFIANAKKKEYFCDEEDIQSDFVDRMEKLNKLSYQISQTEKNKFCFALTYETDNNPIVKLKKPATRTTIELADKYDYRMYYPILSQDDTNIPILAIYYKKPPVSLDDPLSQRIIAHLEKTDLLNYLESEGYAEIEKLLKVAKPKIDTILKHLSIEKDDFHLDHNHLNGYFGRFDTSFDDISVKDFAILSQHLTELTKDIEPHKITYKKYKLKDTIVANDKISFFEKIHKQVLKSLEITDKMQEDYEMLISSLQEEKMNVNAAPLLYNNINDIINAILNNDVSIEDVVENLEANRNVLIIDHSINTLKGIQLGANDLENITMMLDHLTISFKRIITNGYKDIFDFRFIDFYKDIKEIKEANDYTTYEGVPDIYKNIPNFEGQILDDMGVEGDDMDMLDVPTQPNDVNMKFEKYWLSIKYKNASGFVDILKIVLPVIHNVQNDAKLMLNYELLCDELYEHFAACPTKFDLMQSLLKKADIQLTDDFVNNIIKINPPTALNLNMLQSLQISDDLIKIVYHCNIAYFNQIFDMLSLSITWWSLQIVDDIVNDTLIYDENQFLVTYVDKWSLDGSPLKDSKHGVLSYLSAILEDVMRDDQRVAHNAEGIFRSANKLLEGAYKDRIEELRVKGVSNNKKRNNKGKDTYEQLLDTIKKRDGNKLLNDYINALLYMPSYKYKQLHKFLLGCCLQKIGKSFQPDTDIASRNDLQAAKKKYAKSRFTQNKRYKTFMLVKEIHKDEEIEDQFMLPYIDDTPDMAKNDINKWLQEMIDVSNLLPNDKINIFMRSTKDATELCKSYINCFCNTAGITRVKSVEFEGLMFNENLFNARNILLILASMFKMYPVVNEDETKILQSAVDNIHHIMNNLSDLNKYVNEYTRQDIYRINQYVVCRSLCLPFNPDIAQNGILFATVNVTAGFVQGLTKLVFARMIKYLKAAKMPTLEENVAFINNIREQNKDKILKAMNSKTADERNEMMAIKKIGLNVPGTAENLDTDMQNEETYNFNDQYEAEDVVEDDEFRLLDQDDNDDTLDYNEFGFLHA
jgi:hypothetical protein